METSGDKVIHTVVIDDKKAITVTAVKEVTAFTEKEIRLKLLSGNVLTVSGQNLKITGFTETCGKFTAIGNIDGVKYRGVENIIKRMFK